MTEEVKSVIDTSSLDAQITSVTEQVIKEENPEKAKELIDLFNWQISKKNVSRILKLNELYDDVTDQMVTRFKTKPDQFTNSDLIDYMKAVQGAIDTSAKNLEQVKETPVIVQNNTQINVNMGDKFDRDAKERILAAIQATISNANNPPIEVEATTEDSPVIEVEAEEIVDKPVIIQKTAEDIIEEFNSEIKNEEIILKADGNQ